MIYYTNTSLTTPHMAFIGRWSPFHKGHVAIIETKRKKQPKTPVLILVRNSASDLYPPDIRAEYIKRWMEEERVPGTVMIIPDIEGVYWGRGVGYHTEMVHVDSETKRVSATGIRQHILTRTQTWKSIVASRKSSYVLSPTIARIIENGLVLWLTGTPSSGKTTIARALAAQLRERYPHLKTRLLDGDDMRKSPLASFVGFSEKDRADHIRRMAYMAKMFADHGIVVICAFVSSNRTIREEARTMIGKGRFVEVYVRASQQTCMARDTKKLYRRAKRGNIRNLTGYNDPYEKPLHPDVLCPTDNKTVKESVENILAYILT